MLGPDARPRAARCGTRARCSQGSRRHRLGVAAGSGSKTAAAREGVFLSTNLEYTVNWLVTSVSGTVEIILDAGGRVILEPTQIPVGRLAGRQ
jgi:hypothetical protein